MKRHLACALAALSLAAILASPAQAVIKNYLVNLTGPSEFPVNASPGTGSGTVSYDDVAHTLAISVAFSGLTGTVTVSHFHAPTVTSGLGSEAQASAAQNANVATTVPTLPGFPAGVTNGVYANVLDLTSAGSWNPAYVTANGGTTAGAEAAFALALTEGKTYWNIHTSTFGGGEIRGFPFLIPEPGTVALAGAAACGLIAVRRRRA
jgi:hypothetical protein